MGSLDVELLLRRLGIEARKRGREWEALCPNPDHEDRKPSWRIRDEPGSKRHGMHHCWPCSFGGTAEHLAATVLGISRVEAREWIGGAEVDRPVAEAVELRQKSWKTGFRMPEGFEEGPVASWPSGPRRYLDERGIPAAQAEAWGVGYAIEGRLAGRVVFVKRTSDGEPVGYSARTYVGDRTRYLEPLPREKADQGAVFGEQFWPEDGRRERVLFVAEGAINALAIERAAPWGAVAVTSGSQLAAMVAAKISTFGEVVAVTDPDAAGDKLALTLEAATARHVRSFRRVELPKGEDAATMTTAALAEALR